MNEPHQFEASYLGLVDYDQATKTQLCVLNQVAVKNWHAVLGFEHPDVVTFGKRLANISTIELQQLLPDCSLAGKLPRVFSSRGGLITVHARGQLVIYPIVNLRRLGIGIKNYVQFLLDITNELLQSYGIVGQVDSEGIGLLTDNGKIAFCGLHVKDGVSMHGISLNVRNDLGLFSGITACGISQGKFDRLGNYGVDGTLAEIFQQWVTLFTKKFPRSRKIN